MFRTCSLIWKIEKATDIETVAGVVGVAVKFAESQEIFRFYDTPLIDNLGGFSRFRPGTFILIKSKGVGLPLGIHMISRIEPLPFQYFQDLVNKTKYLPLY